MVIILGLIITLVLWFLLAIPCSILPLSKVEGRPITRAFKEMLES